MLNPFKAIGGSVKGVLGGVNTAAKKVVGGAGRAVNSVGKSAVRRTVGPAARSTVGRAISGGR